MATTKKQKKQKLDFDSLWINRTVGLELEGYLKIDPRTIIDSGGIPYCEIKRDGSLFNSNWHTNCSTFGVEIVTEPLSELKPLKEILKKITSYGWSASGRASLHVHVDVGDFTMDDKLRAAYFGKKVEDVMFLFTKNRRYNNRYCRLLPDLFNSLVYEKIPDVNKESSYRLYRYIERNKTVAIANTFQDRYRWMNIFSSAHGTIEFRMFHPIRKAEDAAMFAYLAHNFVSLIKHSSLQQLEFIAQSIEEESNIELKARKLLDSIGVPFDIPILNERATKALNDSRAAAEGLQLVQ